MIHQGKDDYGIAVLSGRGKLFDPAEVGITPVRRCSACTTASRTRGSSSSRSDRSADMAAVRRGMEDRSGALLAPGLADHAPRHGRLATLHRPLLLGRGGWM